MKKFLSHRLRGFDKYEHSYNAIKQACETDIPYLEIDTRVSLDNQIFVYHDSIYKTKNNKKIVIHKTNSREIKKNLHICGHEILLLDELLKIFSQRVYKSQKLCIDIKDFGFEKEHLDLVKKYDLTNHIIWISWIPQTIIELDKISPNTPKILSYINLLNFNILGQLIEKISIIKVPFTNFVLIGKKNYYKKLKKFLIGFQHAYLAYYLPDKLITILSKNKGGICIHKSFFSKKTEDYAKKNKLKLFIFSIESLNEYLYYKEQNIDVIFVDDATIMKDIQKYE